MSLAGAAEDRFEEQWADDLVDHHDGDDQRREGIAEARELDGDLAGEAERDSRLGDEPGTAFRY